MELELKKSAQIFYDIAARKTGAQEQTCEAIVSDSQPDILRIAGVSGEAFCASPSASTHGVMLNGTVRAAVMYIPETGGETCCIPVTMDFSCALELPGVNGENDSASILLGGAELMSLEAKIMNPRKVLLRAELKLWAERAERVELELCSDAERAAEFSVELLRENYSARLLCSAGKRSFTVDDAFEIPAGRPAARELLHTRAAFTSGDYNVIGRRVIFKGTLNADILYRTVAGDIVSYSASLPFSQIAELDDLEDGAECVIRMVPTSAEANLVQNGEGRLIEISAGAEAQLEAYAERRIEAVTDLYSTSMQASADIRPCALTTLYERSSRRATVRDSAETSQQVREIRLMEVDLHPIRITRSDTGGLAFSGEAEVRIAYVGEDGEIGQLRRRVQIALDASGLDVDFDRGDTVLVDARTENLTASPSASNGVELRFDVICELMLMRQLTIGAVASASLEMLPAGAPPRPSVVLRMPEPGETLWSVAKRYCSTIESLCAANGIEDPGALTYAPEGKMLLIPKQR